MCVGCVVWRLLCLSGGEFGGVWGGGEGLRVRMWWILGRVV